MKKASTAAINKILPITQQITTQFNETNIHQLQEQIKRLQKEIQDLKAERERERVENLVPLVQISILAMER